MALTNDKLKKLLDEQYSWPCEYIFKFVVPNEHVEHLRILFQEVSIQEKSSKTGKYISVTVRKICLSSDHVLELYQKAGTIEGIISL